jgi:hypothetical protein
MNIAKISIVSGSLMLAAMSTVSAGPMSVAGSKIVTPPAQVERVQYYGYGYWNPGAAVAGTALGLLSLGTAGALGGYYGYPYGYYAGYSPYYRYGYYRPYYRHYGYWRPYYRHYGYWRPYRHYAYYGGTYMGRSVGYWHHRHHRWHYHYYY